MQSPTTSLSVVLCRIFSMFMGPLMLVVLTMKILTSQIGWATETDGLFGLTVGGLILARWIEFRLDDPRANFGVPARAREFRQYAIQTILVTGLIWLAANILGNHVLNAATLQRIDWMQPPVWPMPRV